MKPDHIELGQLWQQDLRSGARCYVVVRRDGDLGLQITLLDLERGVTRRLSEHGMLQWDSWKAFEP